MAARKPDYPPKTSSRPAALISRRPARLRSGKHIAPASYIQIQTSSLSKKLLGELLRLPSSAVFSLHVQPMDQMTAIKLIKQKQVVLDATKISEQQKAFRSGYDIDIIPRDIDASTNFIFCSKNRRRRHISSASGSDAANGAAWRPASRKTSKIC